MHQLSLCLFDPESTLVSQSLAEQTAQMQIFKAMVSQKVPNKNMQQQQAVTQDSHTSAHSQVIHFSL